MTNDIFRTVRELIQSNKCVLMGNAVNNEGELYADSVENLTAILAMQDSYSEMLAALVELDDWAMNESGAAYPEGTFEVVREAISKAQGA
jgi:hypothetical protein